MTSYLKITARSRKIKRIVLAVYSLVLLLFISFIIRDAVSQAKKSYIINKKDLIRLDSLEHLGRVYHNQSGGKGSGGPTIQITTSDQLSLEISKERYRSIEHIDLLCDMLANHGIVFDAFVSKEDYTLAKEKNKNTRLEVYQIIIGNKEYIDTHKVNQLSKETRINSILLWLMCLGLINYSIYHARKKEKQLSTRD